MIYTRKVTVLCHACKKESSTQLIFGENKKNPDDFSVNCPKCNNWEVGVLPTQNFNILAEL